MRLLFLNQAFYPDSVSTSQYVTDLARDLAAAGHKITVVSGRRDYTHPEVIYPAFETFEGIRIHRIWTPGLGKRRLAFRVADALAYDLGSALRLARLPRPDVVVAFTSPPLAGLLGAVASRLWKARSVHWLMNVNHAVAIRLGTVSSRGLPARALSAAYRYAVRSADRVVVMDERMRDTVISEGAIDPGAVSVVPLWPIHFHSEPDDAAAHAMRRELGLAGKFIIVHSGNLSVIHPLETVLSAAIRLRDDDAIAFVFIGHGAREAEIDATVRRHALTNIVRLPYQPRESLGATLALADLHLIVMGDLTSGLAHSSKIYSILESGRPFLLVGPDENHIADADLIDGRGGRAVRHGDVEGVLREIAAVRAIGLTERAEIVETSRTLARRRFSRQAAVAQFRAEVLRE